jgi:hypothetical protein
MDVSSAPSASGITGQPREGAAHFSPRRSRCRIDRALGGARVVASLVLLLASSACITNKVLDADWESFCSYSLGGATGMSAGGNDAALILAITAAPCLIAAATITAAIALDLVTAPYQLWKGYFPYRIGRNNGRARAAG